MTRFGFMAVAAALMAGCAAPPGGPRPPTTVVYQCDGAQIMARFAGSEATLWLPEDTHTMRSVPAASGVRYEGVRYEGVRYGGDGVTLWTRGPRDAILDRPDMPQTTCTAGPPAAWYDAVDGGVTFRAIGQEPGWLLDLYRNDRAHLRADYGTREVRTPLPRPVEAGDTLTFDAPALRVTITHQPCRDIMSGRPFPATVQVTEGDEMLMGCGMYLAE